MTQRHPARRPGETIGRRDFLRIAGTGLAGAALLATVGPTSVLAQEASPLEKEFEDAAKKYKVPKEVLLSMAYVNTQFEMPPPGTTPYERGNPHGYGTYGIMQLVQNPSSNTLGEAARLTSISEEKLKTDRASNILGGAALLASAQGKKPQKLKDWLGGVHGKEGNGKSYEAVAGVGGGKLYTWQVSEALKKGAKVKTSKGEQVSLAAQDLEAETNDQGEVR